MERAPSGVGLEDGWDAKAWPVAPRRRTSSPTGPLEAKAPWRRVPRKRGAPPHGLSALQPLSHFRGSGRSSSRRCPTDRTERTKRSRRRRSTRCREDETGKTAAWHASMPFRKAQDTSPGLPWRRNRCINSFFLELLSIAAEQACQEKSGPVRDYLCISLYFCGLSLSIRVRRRRHLDLASCVQAGCLI